MPGGEIKMQGVGRDHVGRRLGNLLPVIGWNVSVMDARGQALLLDQDPGDVRQDVLPALRNFLDAAGQSDGRRFPEREADALDFQTVVAGVDELRQAHPAANVRQAAPLAIITWT